MVDTVRTLTALQTLLADNTAGDISAQDMRDMLVSTYPDAFVVKNAVANGVADDTAVIQAEIDAAYTAGGGTVYIPAGDYGVTALTKEFFTKRINVNIVGAGKSATILRKIGGTTTPVIHFYATGTGPIDAHNFMSDFRVVGNAKGHDGIRLTRLAKLEVRNIEVTDCDTGFDSLGTQVSNIYSSSFASNNVGYMSRISEAIYANVMNFFGCQVTDNTTHGFDIGSASGVNLYGCFFNANGTTTSPVNTTTGGMVIRDTVDDEFTLSSIDLKGCWFENNLGMTLKVEASNLFLTIKDTHMISAESGNVADIGVIKFLQLENIIAQTAGDTIISAAVRTLIIGGIIHTYTDNSVTTRIGGQDSARFYEVTAPMISLLERTAASADVAGHGQLWVKNTTPCQLWFTDDAGTDTQLV